MLNLNSVFSFKEVSDLDIELVLNKLSSSSAPGYNGIHPKVLKLVPEELIPVLVDIFNCCIKKCKVPID